MFQTEYNKKTEVVAREQHIGGTSNFQSLQKNCKIVENVAINSRIEFVLRHGPFVNIFGPLNGGGT